MQRAEARGNGVGGRREAAARPDRIFCGKPLRDAFVHFVASWLPFHSPERATRFEVASSRIWRI
jgi:hypothetical protein